MAVCSGSCVASDSGSDDAALQALLWEETKAVCCDAVPAALELASFWPRRICEMQLALLKKLPGSKKRQLLLLPLGKLSGATYHTALSLR